MPQPAQLNDDRQFMNRNGRAPASLPRRAAAICYDLLLFAGLAMVLTLALVLFRAGEAIPPASRWYEALLLAAHFAFFGISWTRGGQTLGARAWKLRVTAMDGRDLNWRQAALRYLSAWILLLPPGLGFIWGWRDPDGLCWHDRLSGTRVVRIH